MKKINENNEKWIKWNNKMKINKMINVNKIIIMIMKWNK